MKLTFWGTRGSIAVPGPDTLRYGGNTTCVELSIPGAPPVVIDAGTGIRALGDTLVADGPVDCVLLMTHAHWDHLLGFPFFSPIFRSGSRIRVGGSPQSMGGLSGIFADAGPACGHFPVAFADLPAEIVWDQELTGQQFKIGPATVSTIQIKHPQLGVAFRFQLGDKAIVFITDNELTSPEGPGLSEFADFCRGADAVVHESQYLPTEREAHVGWGHSDWESVLAMAGQAGVKQLYLTHHDPYRTDVQVAELELAAQAAAGDSLQVTAASEGLVVEV